jgi:hypothetical protein
VREPLTLPAVGLRPSALLCFAPAIDLCVCVNPDRYCSGRAGSIPSNGVASVVVSPMGYGGRCSEHEGQHREYERLNQADEQLQAEERHKADEGYQERHRDEENLAREDIAK